MPTRPRNIIELRKLMAEGDWKRAVLMAASFPRFPEGSREPILSAREGYLRPDFQREIGKDPAALIAAGREALEKFFGEKEPQCG